jgi:hypothetical protein
MAAKLEIEKNGGEIKNKCSLKLLSQSQPNFAEMIPSKIESGISDLRPRWPPTFSISSLAAILVESRDHRTSWKGAFQRPFHQSLVGINPVVSEEEIFM